MNYKVIDPLLAISILDGRNRDKMDKIAEFFSEFALIKNRIRIEVSYLIFLSSETRLFRKITTKEIIFLNSLWQNLDLDGAREIKATEKIINHDVKAVEYYLKEKMKGNSLADLREAVHFGLTSYDINIPAYALMLSDFRRDALLPVLSKLVSELRTLINRTKDTVMLGRTHGQPALPTTMGKELAVYYGRLTKEIRILEKLRIEAKLTGAVGNFNALKYVSPKTDWIKFSRTFISFLGLEANLITTQIIPYESWLRLFDSVRRLNNILLGFSQDIWWYISFEYFTQAKKEEEVGSSTMSHKINPITFENAEGNLGLANSLFEFFGRKMAVSRLQRDLSDSTVKRDFGLAFGFTLLAYDSLLSGLGRISPNPAKMEADLENHWEIFSEGIQTYLRYRGYHDAYELLKEKTRGKVLSKKIIHEIIDTLPLENKEKSFLKINSLKDYLGYAGKLAEMALEENQS